MRAIEEAGGDAADSYNRSLVARELNKRHVKKMRMRKSSQNHLERLAREAASEEKPWNR
jgi:hypothetical protein